MIFNGIPLILTFITDGFVPMLVFIILIWHLGVGSSTDRPSAMLTPPWTLPPADRTAYGWALWVTACWQFVHHFIFTSIKVSLTFNMLHIRFCSQPFLLIIHICSIAMIHAAYGLSKLAHMDVIPDRYARLADSLLYCGFVTRVLAATSVAVLSSPHGPNSRGRSPMRYLHDSSWAWTHTEWHYLMIGDLVWCFGAVVLRGVFLVISAEIAELPQASVRTAVERVVGSEAIAREPSMRDAILAKSLAYNRFHPASTTTKSLLSASPRAMSRHSRNYPASAPPTPAAGTPVSVRSVSKRSWQLNRYGSETQVRFIKELAKQRQPGFSTVS